MSSLDHQDSSLLIQGQEHSHMEIETRYASELFFPRTTFPQIYFEAVANAFDAGATDINIRVFRDSSDDRLEVTIKDNGEGFTDDRFDNFARLQEPEDPYHKGLGRLVYLQYFRKVSVESYYGTKRRSFVFSDDFDGQSDINDNPENKRGTTLRFMGFRKKRLRRLEHIEPQSLKNTITDQFLPLLHHKSKTGADFRITIELDTADAKPQSDLFPDETAITPDDIPSFSEKEIKLPDFGIFDDQYRISLSYFIDDSGSDARVLTAASVDNRTVQIDLIQPDALPPGYSATFLFESDVFTGRSDSARQRLEFPESIPEETVFRALREEIGEVLNTELPQIVEQNEQTRQHFEERYPHLAGLFEERTVGLIGKDEALESAQQRFFQKQKEVLEADRLDDETFKKSLELSSRTLAEYILYREVTIEKLRTASAEDPEKKVHNLIVPRYEVFEGSDLDDDIFRHNAWILDDKFMSFRTVLSEGRLQDVIQAITLEGENSRPGGRPDISMIFSADPDDDEPVDVVVVEVKGRKVDEKENAYVATQLVGRATKLADHCPNIERMWYFGVIEIDDEFARLLRSSGWKPLFSRGEHLYYQEHDVEKSDGEIVPTPMYILSYDAIIKDAAARNSTFLEILKSEIQRTSGV